MKLIDIGILITGQKPDEIAELILVWLPKKGSQKGVPKN